MWTIIDTCLQYIHKIFTVKKMIKPTFSDTYPHYPRVLLLLLLYLLKIYNNIEICKIRKKSYFIKKNE